MSDAPIMKHSNPDASMQEICHEIVFGGSDGILMLDAGGRIEFLNPVAAKLLGGESADLIGTAFPHAVNPDGTTIVEPADGDGHKFVELQFSSVRMKGSDRTIVKMIDISRIKALRSALSSMSRFNAEIIDHAGEGIFVCNEDSEVLVWNQAMTELVGYRQGDALGKKVGDVLSIMSELDIDRSFKNALWGKAETLRDLRIRNRRNGEVRWVSMVLSPRFYGDGSVDGVIGLVRDVTTRKHSEDRLVYRAYHDQLTGLPNRLYFKDALKTAIANANREEHGLSVLLLDLDNFKEVNDRDGHEAGDIILRKSVERIRSNLRRGDSIARYGGDEFVILLPRITGTEDVTTVCEKIIRSLRQPVHAMGSEWRITASIGFTLYPDDARSSTGLINGADEAMYKAKNAGRNRFRRFGEIAGEASGD